MAWRYGILYSISQPWASRFSSPISLQVYSSGAFNNEYSIRRHPPHPKQCAIHGEKIHLSVRSDKSGFGKACRGENEIRLDQTGGGKTDSQKGGSQKSRRRQKDGEETGRQKNISQKSRREKNRAEESAGQDNRSFPKPPATRRWNSIWTLICPAMKSAFATTKAQLDLVEKSRNRGEGMREIGQTVLTLTTNVLDANIEVANKIGACKDLSDILSFSPIWRTEPDLWIKETEKISKMSARSRKTPWRLYPRN